MNHFLKCYTQKVVNGILLFSLINFIAQPMLLTLPVKAIPGVKYARICSPLGINFVPIGNESQQPPSQNNNSAKACHCLCSSTRKKLASGKKKPASL